ncbi:MAG: hypothetical protein AAF543_10650 [Pseudomonadota bacterium]
MDRAELQLSRRKARDRSIALVLVGIVALTPPIVGVSLIDGGIGGIPAPFLYVFGVWSALIAGAAALAGPLLDTEDSPSSAEPLDPDS